MDKALSREDAITYVQPCCTHRADWTKHVGCFADVLGMTMVFKTGNCPNTDLMAGMSKRN